MKVLVTAALLALLFFVFVPGWLKGYLYMPAGWVAVWLTSCAASLGAWCWIEEKIGD